MRIGLLDFEPALARILEALLSQEPGWSVERDLSESLDVVLLAAPTRERVEEMKRRFPLIRLIAMSEWNREPSGVEGSFDRFDGYPALLRLLRG